ncbi:MAG: GHKL domain-containing protein [Clostridia bacterium]|nr:GHKL domain-containing protein [Clostridia bacterium]
MNNVLFMNAIEVLTSIFEPFIVNIFFNSFFVKKNVSKVLKLTCFLLFGMLSAAVSIVGIGALFNSALFVGGVFLLSFFYESSFKNKIFYIVILMSFLIASEVFTLFIIMLLTNTGPETALEPGAMRLIGLIASKMIALFIVKTVCVLKQNSQVKIPYLYWFMLLAIPIISIVTIHTIFTFNVTISDSNYNLLSYISIVGMLLINFVVFYLFDVIQEKFLEQTRYKFLEQQINYQLEHYKSLELSQTKTNKLRHDMKNHLLCIKGLIDGNNPDEATKYIKSIFDLMADNKNEINTGNHVFDCLLNSKIALAANNNINVDKDIKVPPKMNIEPVDICVILGNALDNAIECCSKLVDIEKIIKIKIEYINSNLFCIIKNSMNMNDKLNKKGKYYITSKQEKSMHGFGLENMDNTVAKYNGILDFEQKDGFFTLSFVLYDV